MKYLLCTALLLCSLLPDAVAQYNRYLVQFKHKGGTSFSLANPSAYLSARALERRSRFHIPVDSTDIPVPATYIQEIQQINGVTVLNQSRWLNAISIQTSSSAAVATIEALPFVRSVSGFAARGIAPRMPKEEELLEDPPFVRRGQRQQTGDYYEYGNNSFAEIHLHNGEFLHNIGLRGQGMQIAMLDGGFFNYTGLRAFDSININNQVLSTWDFVARNASVAEDNSHGMMCLSTIAANIPGEFIGKAPKADFHLFRTEDVSSEYPIEEFNWACGAERADSIGADIISSSLGYGYEFSSPVADYPYSDLDGNTTIAARAADRAAAKGLLVFNSAGNSGNDYWKRITTPADGDSVIAVGAVNIDGVVGTFSSYGPSADGRIKPDVASAGVAALVQSTANTISAANGTSFACPNMAGLATCLWQGFPEFSNMQIAQVLKESSSIYNNPNNRIGYGIPDMKKAAGDLLVAFSTAGITQTACTVQIRWTSKDVSAMRYEIERLLPGETQYKKTDAVAAAAGITLSTHSYERSLSLDSLGKGLISFRIRQVIDTAAGSFAARYIDTVSVVVTDLCPPIQHNRAYLSPNPSGGTTNLVIESVNNLPAFSIRIYDMAGHLTYQQQASKDAGRTVYNLPSQLWAKGPYLVNIFSGKNVFSQLTLLRL
ncbi:MAG: S8 family peptidase [Chitinophagaceae bacterium]